MHTMAHALRYVPPEEFPALLREIPDPPSTLYLRGVFPTDDLVYLTVVGSRRYSAYGKSACEHLIEGLRGYPVCVISGLALGIDGIAHDAALAAQLPSVAVPGSGLNDDVVYPAAHRGLAHRILAAGGALVSEFPPDFRATGWGFPRRNRIMAGLAHAVLIIEASERSGTLITARLATEYNRDVLALPGPITHVNAYGPNMLIRLGATPITSSADILEALGIARDRTSVSSDQLEPDEARVMELLAQPLPREDLIYALNLSISQANVLLSRMELAGHIVDHNGMMQRRV